MNYTSVSAKIADLKEALAQEKYFRELDAERYEKRIAELEARLVETKAKVPSGMA